MNSRFTKMRLASASKNRCIGISVWWIEVQQAIMRWNKCIWANYSCFFSLSCVCFYSFSNCSRIIQRSHTHFIQYVFSSFSRSLLCGFFFFSSILYSVSVSVFSFSFSFTVHLHRTDHLSWYVWVCVSMCVRVYRLYVCVYCFLNWSTQTKICNKRQIFLSFICSFFPPKKKNVWFYEKFSIRSSLKLVRFAHNPKQFVNEF